ncbi:EAL domain-containing protein [Caminibacter mediatlanticus TB-2]|uniref:EAL domain-containing protein n=1 Tax=Caminibacter mediatlanticus TB-2 TaxID=391592 RepID=A0ABX5V647_9BACT|nr:GGDEF domain-containing protein [Caminibacter mediatlanticus]QCT93748.1 EAL domain-containing protein [Caminibacter mediatlanticus TB-2]
MLSQKWQKLLNTIDFAFQPIINIHNGDIYGVEALIRNYQKVNFSTINEIFDKAFIDGVLYQLDIALREKAINKFSKLPSNIILFYNLDNRIIFSKDFATEPTSKILQNHSLSQDNICFEISERETLNNPENISHLVHTYKNLNYKLAIDDFGTGIAGLKLLYYAEVDFLKIDRFFIQEIQKDSKKQLFLKNITNLAHLMGIKVIAEGIENKKEFELCKELNVDFIQGYLIQKPTLDIKEIKKNYNISFSNNKSKNFYSKYIEKITPINKNATLYELLNIFKQNDLDFIPVIDENNYFIGIIFEEDLKELLYSPYGLYLAQNKERKISKYIKSFNSIEISWSIEKLLESYSYLDKSINGVIITQGGKYIGFLNNHHIINFAYQKNLELAKSQNPLTKLPGNPQIEKFISNALKGEKPYYLIYFDIDNFKAFNDKYGFRKGDRVITLFSDILQKNLNYAFIGHIGGDDFFVGIKNLTFEKTFEIIKYIQEKFKKDVYEFYDKEDKEKGYIIAKDRNGELKKFDFLTVSAIILEIKKESSKENFDYSISSLKKISKQIDFPICVSLL